MRSVAVMGFVLALCMSGVVAAQDEGDAESSATESSGEAGGEASGKSIFNAEGGAGTEGQPEDKADAKETGPRAWSFGLNGRFVVVPAFMLKLFLDEAPSPTNFGFGVNAVYRGKDSGPNFDFGIGYTAYSFTGPFRTKGGDTNDTEIVESNLGLVHLSGTIFWEAPIAEDKLAFQYGVGLDLGIVTGRMKRTEAYPTGSGFAKCTAPGVPLDPNCGGPPVPYDQKGEQYNVTDKSIPPVMAFPMLPRLGLRYAPIPDSWVRLDAAYGIAQLWFGLSAAYAPKL